MVTEINEPIRVAAVFSGGHIRPVWFDWRNRMVRIDRVAFSWQTREGRASISHFSVTDGANLYEICFNKESADWKLMNSEFGMRNNIYEQYRRA